MSNNEPNSTPDDQVNANPSQRPPSYSQTCYSRSTEWKDPGLVAWEGPKDIFELRQIPPQLHDKEPRLAHRPIGVASPVKGTKWSRRKKLYIGIGSLVAFLVLLCFGLGIALVLKSRQPAVSNNVTVNPTFNITGISPGEASLASPSPTSTTTVTEISTAAAPISTVVTTRLNFVKASSTSSASRAKRGNDPEPSTHLVSSTPSGSLNLVATVTVTSITTPPTSTTTNTVVQDVISQTTLTTTTLRAKPQPPKTSTVVVPAD